MKKEQSQNLDVSLASGTNPNSNHLGALDTQVLLPNWLLGLEHILNLRWRSKSQHQEDLFLPSLICIEIVFIFIHFLIPVLLTGFTDICFLEDPLLFSF